MINAIFPGWRVALPRDRATPRVRHNAIPGWRVALPRDRATPRVRHNAIAEWRVALPRDRATPRVRHNAIPGWRVALLRDRATPRVIRPKGPGCFSLGRSPRDGRVSAQPPQRGGMTVARALNYRVAYHAFTAAIFITALFSASALAADKSLPDPAALATRQATIVQTMQELAKGMNADNATENKIRTILFALAGNELQQSVKLLGDLNRAPDPAAAAKTTEQILANQDRAIKVLQEIMGVVKMMEADAQRAPAPPEGAKTPPAQLQEKLDDLHQKLLDFMKEQQKVISGTADLAKQPMDNLRPEQQQQLKNLQATEDKLGKFLEAAASDLSKLPMQDTAVENMLKELVQTYSEIQKAANALEQKTMEIAVPAEQSAMELAKKLETNIEKWLPDTADRIKWEMEEPLNDYQVPMAELPKELEDLVGELMEQEEDLMKDAQDATSSWQDSADKGAGWDAMDGPISNQSAKGVTGNQLPNDSEIGGRSGEGRTGKTSGEQVTDSAVGKGGRQTPTRLTNEALQPGVVNDTSADPAGGATGGGKISGTGKEGLTGPPPPQIQQKMNALAARQAELRNQAERIKLGFQVSNYPTESISRTIQIMNSMEDDMRNGRYQNVNRQRDVLLKSISAANSVAKGEMKVQRDYNVAIPPELQEKIIDAVNEPAPAGYDDLLKQYYEALSKAQ
jgi:hypothetical protein